MSIKIIRSREGVERKISDSYSVLNLLTAEESERVSVASVPRRIMSKRLRRRVTGRIS